ncbi:MAG: hypothetical protein EAZ91_01550 [Cytophagales bacterium]|nr:MAG: hypothetical protein EAZ91_01550 [Cytophagales bacterium]
MATSELRFNACTLDYLEKTFGLREVDALPSLKDWLAMTADLSDFERESLLYFQQILAFNVRDWYESELDSHFIGPLFTLVNFSTYEFNHFEERELSGVVDHIRLYGRPDGMVARGRRQPETPYFAFQEYKRLTDPNGDPAGQCMAAMLAGQALNKTPTDPIYGCFVIGDRWQFMTLEGRQYATSPGFSATSDDLFDIFRLLKTLKTLVTQRVSELTS